MNLPKEWEAIASDYCSDLSRTIVERCYALHCEAQAERIAELEAQLKLLREIESQHALLQKLTHAEAQVKALEVGLCAMPQSAAAIKEQAK